MSDEIWILGATGRVGRAVAARLHDAGFRLVLAGRDRARLETIAGELGGEPRIVVGAIDIALSPVSSSGVIRCLNTSSLSSGMVIAHVRSAEDTAQNPLNEPDAAPAST